LLLTWPNASRARRALLCNRASNSPTIAKCRRRPFLDRSWIFGFDVTREEGVLQSA
jgi:hypothetical protein